MSRIVHTVFRTQAAQENFTVISNRLLQDPRLKADVRGFIATRLSYPKDWMISVAEIISKYPEKRDKVYRMIKDACDAGYMGHLVVKNDDGMITDHVYYVTDDPNGVAIPAETEDGRKLVPFKAKKTAETRTSGKAVSPENRVCYATPSGKAGSPGIRHSQNSSPRNTAETRTSGKAVSPDSSTSGKTARIQSNKDKIINNSIARAREGLDLKNDKNQRIYNPADFKNAHKLPAYWRVEPKLRNWARNGKIGATDEQIDEQADVFRDHYEGTGKRMKDFNATYRNWLRRAKEWGHVGQVRQRPAGGHGGYTRSFDESMAALNDRKGKHG